MQPAFATARNRFVNGGLATASPAKILEMAFERLDRDLATALEALARNEIERCHSALCHAQDLVIELNLMLDQEAWEHADALSSIYMYVLEVLTRANVRKSVTDVEHARSILADIGGAFSTASAQVQQAQAAPSTSMGAPASVTPLVPGNARSSLSLRA